jgi:hypothetical protein
MTGKLALGKAAFVNRQNSRLKRAQRRDASLGPAIDSLHSCFRFFVVPG